MDLKSILALDLTMKGFDAVGKVKKVWEVQERKGGYFFQNVIIEDMSGEAMLAISYGQEKPTEPVTTANIGQTLKATKCGLNLYNKKINLKTSHFLIDNGALNESKASEPVKEGLSDKTRQEATKQPIVNDYQIKKDAFEEHKQLLIVRQNCIGNAVLVVNTFPFSSEVSQADRAMQVKIMASLFEDYVFNGLSKDVDGVPF